ncbi:hypothetical protein D3C80_2136470 [compost metagenome]
MPLRLSQHNRVLDSLKRVHPLLDLAEEDIRRLQLEICRLLLAQSKIKPVQRFPQLAWQHLAHGSQIASGLADAGE